MAAPQKSILDKPLAARDAVFISHANPEDNEFSKWLAYRLALEGYPVWCDLTEFRGGERFWTEAEKAIREKAIKFLYVLSKHSNIKDGVRNELRIAKHTEKSLHLKDFILPLHVDDLPHSDINIELTNLITVQFDRSWAAGLNDLLEKLEKAGISKSSDFGPAAVSQLWRSQFDNSKRLQREPEPYLSNWFPILSLPKSIFFHTLERKSLGLVAPDPFAMSFPGFMDGIDLVTFAKADALKGTLGQSVEIADSHELSVSEVLANSEKARLFTKDNGKRWLIRLLQSNWNSWLSSRLNSYELANKSVCYYFSKPASDSLDLPFIDSVGKSRVRGIVGYSTLPTGKRRYWHFAIQAKPLQTPELIYSLSSHVIFTEEGLPLSSTSAMHKARRRQCKNWHNPEWRDRLLAFVYWLANGQGFISIPTGQSDIVVSATPKLLESPFSFIDPLPKSKRASSTLFNEEEDKVSGVDEDEGEEDDDE